MGCCFSCFADAEKNGGGEYPGNVVTKDSRSKKEVEKEEKGTQTPPAQEPAGGDEPVELDLEAGEKEQEKEAETAPAGTAVAGSPVKPAELEPEAPKPSKAKPPPGGTIDVNSVDLETLESIKGVSTAVAKRIFDARPFPTWDEMIYLVKGVGPKKVEKLQSHPGVYLGEVEIPYGSSTELGLSIKEEFPRRVTHDPEVSIATWNIRHLSNSRSDEALKIIGATIAKFDIVAVQEIRDIEVLERLRDEHMPADQFDFVVSEKVLFGKNDAVEYYAFFYRKPLITVRSKPKIVKFKPRNNGDAAPASGNDDAAVVEEDDDGPFSRSPFVGYFSAKHFEFVLCTIHIIWGDGSKDVHREVKLLDEVMAGVQNFVKEEKDVILLGDFNLDYYSDAGAWQLNESSSQKWTPLIQRPNYSTYSEDRLGTHLYDQIWVSRETYRLFTQRAGVIYFDRDVFGDTPSDRKKARKLVSDHRPVWAIFRDHDLDDDISLDFSEMHISDPRDRQNSGD